MPARPTRLARALIVRDAVLQQLLVGSMNEVRLGDFQIMRHQAGGLDWTLDVWHRCFGKVLNLEWFQGDAPRDGLPGALLVRFAPGRWDSDLLALIEEGKGVQSAVFKPGPAAQAALRSLRHTLH